MANPNSGVMTKLADYLYVNSGVILAARSRFIAALNAEPTVLILPPAARTFYKPEYGTALFYNMAVIIGDVEEPTLGFGVSLVL